MSSTDAPRGHALNGNGKANIASQLTPGHLADLRASGLNDETIERCGFHSLRTADSIQRTPGWKGFGDQLGDCLAIPFFGADGKPTGYSRLKSDRPRLGKEDGKPIKYEAPKGKGNRAYFPPETLAVLHETSIPLVLTEGEKKAAKADQERFPCIGITGVWSWQRKQTKDKDGKPMGKRDLIPDLAALPWQGRLVHLSFDSDAATNPQVRNAEWEFAKALARSG